MHFRSHRRRCACGRRCHHHHCQPCCRHGPHRRRLPHWHHPQRHHRPRLAPLGARFHQHNPGHPCTQQLRPHLCGARQRVRRSAACRPRFACPQRRDGPAHQHIGAARAAAAPMPTPPPRPPAVWLLAARAPQPVWRGPHSGRRQRPALGRRCPWPRARSLRPPAHLPRWSVPRHLRMPRRLPPPHQRACLRCCNPLRWARPRQCLGQHSCQRTRRTRAHQRLRLPPCQRLRLHRCQPLCLYRCRHLRLHRCRRTCLYRCQRLRLLHVLCWAAGRWLPSAPPAVPRPQSTTCKHGYTALLGAQHTHRLRRGL
jgi:hypothetical protein